MHYQTLFTLILATTQQNRNNDLISIIAIVVSVALVVAVCVASKSKKSSASGKSSKTVTAAIPKEDPVAMGRITGTGVRKAEPVKTGTASGTKAGGTKTDEPEEEIPVDPRSADERYAAARNLWICRYCESLNPYPPGMAPVKASVPAAAPARKTALRGDLLSKSKKPEPTPVKTPGRMFCVACGKQHT